MVGDNGGRLVVGFNSFSTQSNRIAHLVGTTLVDIPAAAGNTDFRPAVGLVGDVVYVWQKDGFAQASQIREVDLSNGSVRDVAPTTMSENGEIGVSEDRLIFTRQWGNSPNAFNCELSDCTSSGAVTDQRISGSFAIDDGIVYVAETKDGEASIVGYDDFPTRSSAVYSQGLEWSGVRKLKVHDGFVYGISQDGDHVIRSPLAAR